MSALSDSAAVKTALPPPREKCEEKDEKKCENLSHRPVVSPAIAGDENDREEALNRQRGDDHQEEAKKINNKNNKNKNKNNKNNNYFEMELRGSPLILPAVPLTLTAFTPCAVADDIPTNPFSTPMDSFQIHFHPNGSGGENNNNNNNNNHHNNFNKNKNNESEKNESEEESENEKSAQAINSHPQHFSAAVRGLSALGLSATTTAHSPPGYGYLERAVREGPLPFSTIDHKINNKINNNNNNNNNNKNKNNNKKNERSEGKKEDRSVAAAAPLFRLRECTARLSAASVNALLQSAVSDTLSTLSHTTDRTRRPTP